MGVFERFGHFVKGLAAHEQQALHDHLTSMGGSIRHFAQGVIGTTPGSINGLNHGQPTQLPPGRVNQLISPYVNQSMQHLSGPGSTNPYNLPQP